MLPSVSDRWSDLQGRKELVIIIKSSFLRVDRLHRTKHPPFIVIDSGRNSHTKPMACYAVCSKDCKKNHELPGVGFH